MSIPEIAKAYEDALNIVIDARIDSSRIDAIWNKLDRVAKQLNDSVSEQLSSSLEDIEPFAYPAPSEVA